MGGPGSGRRPASRRRGKPLTDEAKERLWQGRIRASLKRGNQNAVIEFGLRLMELRLDNLIERDPLLDCLRVLEAVRSSGLHVGAEDRTKRLERVGKILERRQKPGQQLRGVGPPPDSLAEAGGPKPDAQGLAMCRGSEALPSSTGSSASSTSGTAT